MLESLRQKIDRLSLIAKFIIRIIYPVTTYIILYFVMFKHFKMPLQTTQMAFIVLWILVEWQLFFKKPIKTEKEEKKK